MNYEALESHDIVCIDMKSFYASCECILRGLNPLSTKLAVVGDINRNGSVVLASSPLLKLTHQIKTGSRLYEIQRLQDEEIIIAQARMGEYYKIAKSIVDIFEEFVPPNSIHIYSVDESWLTFDGTKKIHGNVRDASRKLMDAILEKTGIPSAVGIGDNKFLAKTALDNYGKKTGIGEIRYKDVEKMIHTLRIDDMWGVGEKMKKHFYNLGIFTIRDLAYTPVELIQKRFGKAGLQLHQYSWGIDKSPVFYDEKNPPTSVFGFSLNDSVAPIKSVGRGVTLLSDYYKREDIILVIRDLIEEVCFVLRQNKMGGRTIHLSLGYSKSSPFSGFSRQKTIKTQISDTHLIFEICESILDLHHRWGEPVRKINVSVGKLDVEMDDLINVDINKRRKLANVSDVLNNRFGKGTVMKASNLKEESIAKERTKKIKGHFE